MDIKDFILIAGGSLIVMVIAHGFWLAYRSRRETLRMDIVPDLVPGAEVDELERLRGELPNGGARPRKPHQDFYGAPAQRNAELLDPFPQGYAETNDEAATMETGGAQPSFSAALDDARESEPSDDRRDADAKRDTEPTGTRQTGRQRGRQDERQIEMDLLQAGATARVHGVQLPGDPITAEAPAGQARADANNKRRQSSQAKNTRRRPQAAASTTTREDPAEQNKAAMVQELLVVNVIAPRGTPFQGQKLVHVMQQQGLRYGDMSIYHRVVPTTKAKLFSVANIVEPGTFDLSDLDQLSSPGMSFFLQLPGPDHALDAFEDMVKTARRVGASLGGEVRDENLNLLTRQTEQHMRQRISDFARRRLSMRA